MTGGRIYSIPNRLIDKAKGTWLAFKSQQPIMYYVLCRVSELAPFIVVELKLAQAGSQYLGV